MTWTYQDTPEKWDAIVKACYARGVVGADTETYGHNVKESTPAYRAKIDVWSLALSTSTLSPRGYYVARACVLPLEAALYPPMKGMLESKDILHVFHNAHHDQHAFANHGVLLGAVYDTLDAVRLCYPGMDSGYSLKPVRQFILGKGSREGFKGSKKKGTEGLTDPLETQVSVKKEKKVCSCGNDRCRKSPEKYGDEHEKVMEDVFITKTVKMPCPIESIVFGHPRWLRKIEYAGDDAADALELYQLLQTQVRHLDETLPPLPWEHGAGTRPAGQ